ncbi:hypothetical protein [Marinifilum fragile]|uniref:hypothetical protein n=1 Tax=Marinifilum fragile TaxID=570161 RepID=UPI002AA9443D|nr:hypothetical protein [Marinifilum fragile]
MKRTFQLSIILLFTLLIGVCSSNTKSEADKRLGKMEVEIPAELKSKPEVVKYIKGMSEVADDYALMIDNIFEDVGEYAGKDESELGVIDKIKLTKATAEVAVRSAEIMGKWGEYQSKRAQLEEQLSDAETEALENVWERFEQRIEQIEARHSKVFEKKE